jgi:hypothetical protein
MLFGLHGGDRKTPNPLTSPNHNLLQSKLVYSSAFARFRKPSKNFKQRNISVSKSIVHIRNSPVSASLLEH